MSSSSAAPRLLLIHSARTRAWTPRTSIATAPAPSCRCAHTAPTAWAAPRACRARPRSLWSPAHRAPSRQHLLHPRHPLPFASTLSLASECQLMPRMATAATTAARAPGTRMASTAPTAPTAACADRCHCRPQVHPSARASAWRRASAPIAPTADRTPPCNRRRRLWLYRLHRLQGCRPLLAPRDGRRPLYKARRVDALACSRWSSLRWLASSHGWWGCLEHCDRARCETGREEHVGVGEEGRSRDVLDGESGWLSFSASTGWRAWNATRSRRRRRCAPSTAHTPSPGRRPPT